jgi:hypothetical protein
MTRSGDRAGPLGVRLAEWGWGMLNAGRSADADWSANSRFCWERTPCGPAQDEVSQ